MASDARAAARRANRSKPKPRPAKPKAPEGDQAKPDEVVVDGMITVLVKRDGPQTMVDIRLDGDVRSTEAEKLLEYARKRAVELFG